MKIKIAFAALTLSLCSLKAVAQADIHFSQFYETSILRNPSLTGVFEKEFKVGGNYKKQWESISYPFETMLAYGEVRRPIGRASNDFISFGFLGYRDKAGSLSQQIVSMYPAVNYSKCLDEEHNTYLSVGFTAGYTQYSFDRSGVTVNNQYQNGGYSAANPTRENFSNTALSLWDLGTGINFNSSSGSKASTIYMFGVAGYHLSQPNYSYKEIPGVNMNMRWNINGAVSFNVIESVASATHLNVALQGAFSEIMIGNLFSYSMDASKTAYTYMLTAGVFYRVNDAIIPVVRLSFKNLSFGYSYDVNVSRLTPASQMRGGNEFTLYYSGYLRPQGEAGKTVCPKF
ncbi:MAG: type IX secretion system membrane protein PorP/SprF [Chitinophagia bacterium]|nr:type IX secretion system membrane protein PorP/SprF [Chitinophagia bacterium]